MQAQSNEKHDEKAALVRRWIEEGWNKGHTEVASEIFAPDYVQHNAVTPDVNVGVERIKKNIDIYRHAFPDLHTTILEQFTSGDRVATRWRAAGTHKGELFGLAPTGKTMSVHGMVISRVVHGRIVEEWDLLDNLGLLTQIGMVEQGVARIMSGTELN